MDRTADTLVLAGVSVRAMAESARQAGWQVIALDLFGDADTRRICRRWMPIGDPAALEIDPVRLRDALAAAAREPGVMGWVAGSGFEAAPQLLKTAGGLALLGMSADPVRTLRDARQFFGVLDRLGLTHPEIRFDRPVEAAGWLAKWMGGTGGWHIRAASDADSRRADAHTYFQRIEPGIPMSVLFVADGRQARAVALNRLIVRRLGAFPFVYHGAIGPVRDGALQARIDDILALLVPAFALRGLASLDFVAANGMPSLLEINPRPSASMALHAHAWPRGLLHAHIASMHGALPPPPSLQPGVRGTQVLFARRPYRVDTHTADALGRLADCHDLPAPGTKLGAAEPVCSVTVEAPDEVAVERTLADRLGHIEALLDNFAQSNLEVT